MNTIDVMEQALEALQDLQRQYILYPSSFWDWSKGRAAVEALEQAIQQKEQAKPVAWRYVVNGVWTNYIEIEPPDDAYDKGSLTPLYAIPPSQPVPVKTCSGGKAWPVQTEWVGLTDDELDSIYKKHHNQYGEPYSLFGYEQAIQAKLKEKNSKG
jgi:hypothetical protein